MISIHDRNGLVVGLLNTGFIVDTRGAHRAFLERYTVFDYCGRRLGHFRTGNFVDESGATVAFVPSAVGGPSRPPVMELTSLHSPSAAPKRPRCLSTPPVASVQRAWSSLTWEGYLASGSICARGDGDEDRMRLLQLDNQNLEHTWHYWQDVRDGHWRIRVGHSKPREVRAMLTRVAAEAQRRGMKLD